MSNIDRGVCKMCVASEEEGKEWCNQNRCSFLGVEEDYNYGLVMSYIPSTSYCSAEEEAMYLPMIKNCVIYSEGFTDVLYVGIKNSYVYYLSEAKRFTEESAFVKARKMTDNSKTGRLWKVRVLK